MASRRDFLQLGIAVSALPLALKTLQTSPAVRTEAVPVSPDATRGRHFYKVIVDSRIPESLRFGERMREMGSVVHEITGDITDLWFHDLHAQWTKQPVAIAGLTEHGPLFCLERLAWDHQMRVVYRAEHTPANGCLQHRISGPEQVLSRAASLETAGADWDTHAARLVSACPDGRSPAMQATVVTRLTTVGGDREPLLSWVIAPVA